MRHQFGKYYKSDTGLVILCLGTGATNFSISGVVIDAGNTKNLLGEISFYFYAPSFNKELSISLTEKPNPA